MSPSLPETQPDVIQALHRLPLRFPRSPRELFQILGMKDASGGLEALLDRIDLTGVTRVAIYNLVHARAPESPDAAVTQPGYDPRQHLLSALRSKEFQSNVLRNILRAFPEKRRDVFLHVPECAGTDLVRGIALARLSVSQRIAPDCGLPSDDFLTAIGCIAQTMPFYDEIFVHGHLELANYVRTVGVNHRDAFFTVLRDPFDLLLSQANHAVAVLRQDPEGKDADTAAILRCLDLPRLASEIAPTDLKRLAVRCFLDHRISRPNRMCCYFSEHAAPRFNEAMKGLVVYDVEISAASHYARFARERWNIAPRSTGSDQSPVFLTRTEAERYFGGRVMETVAEDQKLYDVVQWALAQTGKASVSGTEIARLAGPTLLSDFPAEIATRTSARQTPPPTVVQDEAAIAQYLAPIPDEFVADERRPVETLAITFVPDGNSGQFVAEGWSSAERRHTWTCGTKAVLVLPRPPDSGQMIVQMDATPYTWEARLPYQRVEIAVNGTRLDAVKLRYPSVLDWEIPREAVVGHDSIRIEFDLPDSTRPVDVAGVPDDRLLGISVKWLRLLRIGRAEARSGVTVAPQPEPLATPELPARTERSVRGAGEGPATPLKDLMMSFESLGENCEFGLVQRRCGAEPIGLLRFASTPYAKLVAALEHGFEGMGAPGTLEVEIAASGREYMIADKQFGVLYHAWVDVGEKPPEEILERELRRVPFLVRKLKEDLAAGEKLFVFHGMEPLTLPQAIRLADAVRQFGDGTLLWMELADNENAAGSVREIKPGLLKGHMDRFAPGENAHDLALDTWLTVCKRALSVSQPAVAK